jgi:hypothetical protein
MTLKHAVTAAAPRVVLVLTVLAGLLGVVGSAAPANAWTRGLNRVQTGKQDPAASTGYGPGWVGLSYKTNGPIVGYLFASGFPFSNGKKRGSERMDIRGTRDYKGGHPDITRWPWGYAFGSFDGCAYAYGISKFAKISKRHATGRCAKGPRQGPHRNWWVSERAFCTAHRTDELCSPVGVWATGKPKGHHGTKKARSLGCTVYGNIGAAAPYGKGTPRPRHPLGQVDPTKRKEIDVRYVTKDRKYVMAKWHGHPLAGGIKWAFFPRSCLT